VWSSSQSWDSRLVRISECKCIKNTTLLNNKILLYFRVHNKQLTDKHIYLRNYKPNGTWYLIKNQDRFLRKQNQNVKIGYAVTSPHERIHFVCPTLRATAEHSVVQPSFVVVLQVLQSHQPSNPAVTAEHIQSSMHAVSISLTHDELSHLTVHQVSRVHFTVLSKILCLT